MEKRNNVSAMNLTEGNIFIKIIFFALPIIAGNMLQELYNFFDTLIVGKTLGVGKLAAVGATSSLAFMVIGFVIGLTSGCAVITAQSYGAGDIKEMKKSIVAHLYIAGIFTIVLTIISVFCAGPLLSLLKTTPDTYNDAKIYLTIIFAGIPASMLYNMLSSLLRAVGDSKTPLKFLAVSSVLNICLDLLFIVIFKWDVAGAAIATVFSQVVSGVLCFVYIRKKVPLLLPDKESFHDYKNLVIMELKVGMPMAFQYATIAIGMMVLQYVLNGFGSNAVAAYTVGGKIQRIVQSPMDSMSVVIVAFIGQNAGAGLYSRIKEGVRKCLIMVVGYSVIIGSTVLMFSKPIILLFVEANETAVIDYTKEYLMWVCPMLWTLGFLFIFRGSLQGLGDGLIPMIGSLCELIMRTVIPLLLGASIGFTSVCIAGPLAWTSCAILVTSMYFIKERNWSCDNEFIEEIL